MMRLIVEPKNKRELLLVEKILDALEVKYGPVAEDSPYHPDVVAKVLKGREDSKNGQTTRVIKEDLKNFLGL
jgi:hypothetical protein